MHFFSSSGFSGGYFAGQNRPHRATPHLYEHFDDPGNPVETTEKSDQPTAHATRLNEPGPIASHPARGPGGNLPEAPGFPGSKRGEADLGQYPIPRKPRKSHFFVDRKCADTSTGSPAGLGREPGARIAPSANRQTDDAEFLWVSKNGHAVFSVRDSGIGIVPHERKRIFRRFY